MTPAAPRRYPRPAPLGLLLLLCVTPTALGCGSDSGAPDLQEKQLPIEITEEHPIDAPGREAPRALEPTP